MATLNWLQTLFVGMAVGAVSMDLYHRHYQTALDLRAPAGMAASIADAGIHLGWECHDTPGMTLDSCRRLAAGVTKATEE